MFANDSYHNRSNEHSFSVSKVVTDTFLGLNYVTMFAISCILFRNCIIFCSLCSKKGDCRSSTGQCLVHNENVCRTPQTWIRSNIPTMKNFRVSAVSSSYVDFFQGAHISFEQLCPSTFQSTSYHTKIQMGSMNSASNKHCE